MTISQTLTARTETTVTMAWTSDSVIDYLWYSTDGTTWTGINIATGRNGSYTINGLTANTTYQIKTRVRNKDTQETEDSSAASVTTYAYPYANSMPSFTVGERVTIGIYNPLRRTITVNLIGADDSQVTEDTITGTSISGFNDTATINKLLQSLPNAVSGTYKVKVTYGTNADTKTGGTYSISNVYAPSIDTVSYQDTNATVTAITSDNQKIVRNQSTVQFTATGLTALQDATISSCSVNVNGNVYSMTISGTSASVSNIVIDRASDITAVITVTDSRGNSSSKDLEVTVLNWTLPTAIISLQRQSNYYSATDINVNADYSSLDSLNSVTIQCRYKKVSASTYSAWSTLTDEVTSTLNLDNNYEWDVQVKVEDLFGNTTYNLTLPIGMPTFFVDRILNSIGINCFPTNQKSLEVNGINLALQEISSGADLDDLLTARWYFGEASGLSNCPVNSGTFILTVYDISTAYMQVVETIDKTAPKTYKRCYYSSSWGNWVEV